MANYNSNYTGSEVDCAVGNFNSKGVTTTNNSTTLTDGKLIQGGNNKTVKATSISADDVVTATNAAPSEGLLMKSGGNDKTVEATDISADDVVTATNVASSEGLLMKSGGNDKTVEATDISADDVAQVNGYYPDMGVGTADNLVSADTEQDISEMKFRSTGGNISVTTGRAVVEKIYGNTTIDADGNFVHSNVTTIKSTSRNALDPSTKIARVMKCKGTSNNGYEIWCSDNNNPANYFGWSTDGTEYSDTLNVSSYTNAQGKQCYRYVPDSNGYIQYKGSGSAFVGLIWSGYLIGNHTDYEHNQLTIYTDSSRATSGTNTIYTDGMKKLNDNYVDWIRRNGNTYIANKRVHQARLADCTWAQHTETVGEGEDARTIYYYETSDFNSGAEDSQAIFRDTDTTIIPQLKISGNLFTEQSYFSWSMFDKTSSSNSVTVDISGNLYIRLVNSGGAEYNTVDDFKTALGEANILFGLYTARNSGNGVTISNGSSMVLWNDQNNVNYYTAYDFGTEKTEIPSGFNAPIMGINYIRNLKDKLRNIPNCLSIPNLDLLRPSGNSGYKDYTLRIPAGSGAPELVSEETIIELETKFEMTLGYSGRLPVLNNDIKKIESWIGSNITLDRNMTFKFNYGNHYHIQSAVLSAMGNFVAFTFMVFSYSDSATQNTLIISLQNKEYWCKRVKFEY